MCPTFEEIVDVTSIDQLRNLYDDCGYYFSSEKQFLHFLKGDWKEKTSCELRELKTDSKKVKPLEVIVDGVTHNIYGIIHSKATGVEYISRVNNAINPEENWLFEQNLQKYFTFPSNAVEVPDHIIRPWSIFRSSFKNGALLPINLPIYFVLKYPGRKLRDFTLKLIKDAAIKLLDHHPEVISKNYPSYIKIELNERQNPAGYNSIQTRLAYQAEFMKAWKKGEPKHILVGLRHAPEIKYFLEQGVKNQKIVDAAQSHVELLETDPEKFSNLVKRARLGSNINSVLGLTSGLTTSVTAIYKLGELFF